MIAKVNPSQRLNDKPHEAWVGMNKRTCAIVTAHCTCLAGYANNQKFCSFCAFVYLILTYVVDSEKSVLMLLVCFSKSKPVLGLELHQRHVLPIHVYGTRHFQKRYCNCMDRKAVFSYIFFLRWNQPLLLSVVSTDHVASKKFKVPHHPPLPLVAPLLC